jgi:hypothetical protein
MARQRTTIDVFKVFVDYGQGKEYTCAEFTPSAARRTVNEYRENSPAYPVEMKRTRDRKSNYTISQLQEIENEIKAERQLQAERRRKRREQRTSTQTVGC